MQSKITTENNFQLSTNFEDQHRLKKFFTKLLTEAQGLKVTQIKCLLSDKELTIELCQQHSPIKDVKVNPAWYNHIGAWLKSRSTELWNTNSIENFTALCKVEQSYCKMQVEINSQAIFIENLEFLDASRILNKIICDQQSLNNLPDILNYSHGIIVVSSTCETDRQKAIKNWLSLTSACYMGSLRDQQICSVINILANKELVIIDSPSLKLTGMLSELNTKLKEFDKSLPIWLIQNSFPMSLCSKCSDNTRIATNELAEDKHKIDNQEISLDNLDSHKGCEHCEFTGYAGNLSITKAIAINEELRILITGNLGARVIQEHLIKSGYPDINDIATEAVCNKKTDLHALIVCNLSSSSKSEAIQVADDFFTADNQSIDITKVAEIRSLEHASHHNTKQHEKTETKILLVEDDLSQREILQMTLDNMGYSVSTAENGLEALGLLQTDKPDLIITDIMMPKMNGTELVRKLKANKELDNIAVMVLTVLNDPDKEYDLLDLGVEDYCEKSTPSKILMKRIENLVKRKALKNMLSTRIGI